jgi:hypothetical protein
VIQVILLIILQKWPIYALIDGIYDIDSEKGKKLLMASIINELAYTKLILSIDDKTSRIILTVTCSLHGKRLQNKFERLFAPYSAEIGHKA